MMDLSPKEIADVAIEKGIAKANSSFLSMVVLGFLGGAFIAIGYLAYIRVTGTMPASWGSFDTFMGAAVFPTGLILILVGGGELVTGNMMAVSMACFDKKINILQLIWNWLWITIFNLIGALFVAYFFGHFIGLTEGDFLAKTVHTAEMKTSAPFWQAFVSGIGCNWLVSMAVWLCYGAKTFAGKILGIWFPIMAFVLIGFQHVVANMFIIPAAIFAGHLSWMLFLKNIIAVFLGNAAGAVVFVSMLYFIAYKKEGVQKTDTAL
ncbi:formate/nitrite transporter family protein [Weizmannia coagulans]|jgi:formate/nitrite transporter|uniref:Formate/nitrite transporter n=3 Tax=Heyndrickxia TaxID=2837504 RepID=A0AAN0T7I8_HEYCO|nr:MULTISPECIES: formate/nitrite transporter family protein [Heyndrickxia]AJO24287.1 formate/nitrite transporter [Heyndrickxia coagulans]AKN54242.1 Formate efflux transporter [Heyndrickxia coagulans]KGB30518.1 formate/nitrite transporter [Heyndrickxia coagulans]MCR4446130.1 formate/nitrite transporter family protein [Heyndrickxia coagulans]MCW8782602.1 formate/nitrite transporter family protein [Heyndrickxia coagulans]